MSGDSFLEALFLFKKENDSIDSPSILLIFSPNLVNSYQIKGFKEVVVLKALLKEHIKITPGISGGKPRIAGHRIRVMDIVLWHHKCGWSPDEIVSQFPQLTLADVYAALTYYWDHKKEVEAEIRRAEEAEAKARSRHPSKLIEKLEEKRSEILSGRAYPKRQRIKHEDS